MAANHCSYADVTALLSQVDAVVLAKAEVASWPILGWAARLGDTVFVARSRVRSRRRALQQLEQLYALGVSVLVFPEGTTSATWGARPFQPGIFKSAARLGARVVPVSIRYARPDDAWVGDATFVGHFLTTFARPAVEVCLSFGEPLRGEDGLSLCASAVAHIDRALGRLQPVTTDAQGAQRASEQQPQAT